MHCHMGWHLLSPFFFYIFSSNRQMDKINKIKVNNVTYEIGSTVDMSQQYAKKH